MSKQGFVKMYNNITAEIIEKCGANGLMLYLVILSHRNTQTNNCFPSLELLMEECGVSKSTVQRSIKKLYEEGFLIIESGRHGISNTYFFPKENFYKGEGVGAVRVKKGNFSKKEKVK